MKLNLVHVEMFVMLCALCASNLLKFQAFGNHIINRQIECPDEIDFFTRHIDTKIFAWVYFSIFLSIYARHALYVKSFTQISSIWMYKVAQWIISVFMLLMLTVATTNTCPHIHILIHVSCLMPMVYVEFLL